ncbi:MAG: ABC transporter ATP-binding protein [Patescibacteria group bacterium]|nr:ABC transporter ATP-binding protein [Patescibacteria group bacterium]
MEKIISIKNLNKSYGAVKAVDNLNLSVDKGEFFGFLGPNGAGKTTTIRILTGMMEPDNGNIEITTLNHGTKSDIHRFLGVIPESRGFYEWMTGEEYLLFFANLYQIEGNAVKKVDELLKKTDLLRSKNKKIGAYSRGMKQRLGLARALINDPKILILDEPTLGLDPQGQEDIKKMLKELNSKGVTIFYSSHILPEVENLCTKVAIIDQGKLVAQGTIQELKDGAKVDTLTEVFLKLTTPNHD